MSPTAVALFLPVTGHEPHVQVVAGQLRAAVPSLSLGGEAPAGGARPPLKARELRTRSSIVVVCFGVRRGGQAGQANTSTPGRDVRIPVAACKRAERERGRGGRCWPKRRIEQNIETCGTVFFVRCP